MRFKHLSVMLLFFSGFLAAPVLQAQSSGQADYAGVEGFPGAEIVDHRVQENTVYELALGRMQRVDGRVAPSRSERLQGDLTRITYGIPSGYSAEDAYEFFRDQLLGGGQSVLFECEGRGCGSSNFWANDKFGNRILYGPESGQFYMASTYMSQREEQQVSGYVALYAITRGNRRVYAHLDFLEIPLVDEMQLAVTPEVILARLEEDGTAVLPSLSFDQNDDLVEDEGVDLLVQALRRDTLLEVYLVAHLREAGNAEDLMARSLQRAENVRERLIEEGINASRLEAHGLGPLAPYCRPGPCAERVEVVSRP